MQNCAVEGMLTNARNVMPRKTTGPIYSSTLGYINAN